MQNVSFVLEEGGGYVLSPFFSDLTEGKPLFFVKACFSPSKLFPLFFFFRLFTTFRNGCVVCREVLFPDLSPIKTSFGLYRLFMF